MSAGDEAAPFDRLVDTAAAQMTDLTGLPNLPLIDALSCGIGNSLIMLAIAVAAVTIDGRTTRLPSAQEYRLMIPV